MTSVFTSTTAGPRRSRRIVRRSSSAGVLAAVLAVGLTVTASGASAASLPRLGTTAGFAVLAGQGITNTGTTTVTGDVGTSPNPSTDGGLVVTGTNRGNDGVSAGAQVDLVTAYDDLEAAGPATPIPAGQLGGTVVSAGVHNSGAFDIDITGSVTLDGGGDPDAVFVFQSPSALTTASGSSVLLTNGAQACNVFWQVTSSATLGTATAFRGTIVALTSITLGTGATVDGRVLARNGAVDLRSNTITRPVCGTPPGTGGSGGSGASGGASGTPQVQRVPVGSVDTGDGSLVAPRLRSERAGVPSA
jgi:hypothetical protein